MMFTNRSKLKRNCFAYDEKRKVCLLISRGIKAFYVKNAVRLKSSLIKFITFVKGNSLLNLSGYVTKATFNQPLLYEVENDMKLFTHYSVSVA